MAPDDAELDDVAEFDGVMVPSEEAHPDHREHAKAPSRPDDDELARRTEHEREVVEADRESGR